MSISTYHLRSMSIMRDWKEKNMMDSSHERIRRLKRKLLNRVDEGPSIKSKCCETIIKSGIGNNESVLTNMSTISSLKRTAESLEIMDIDSEMSIVDRGQFQEATKKAKVELNSNGPIASGSSLVLSKEIFDIIPKNCSGEEPILPLQILKLYKEPSSTVSNALMLWKPPISQSYYNAKKDNKSKEEVCEEDVACASMASMELDDS